MAKKDKEQAEKPDAVIDDTKQQLTDNVVPSEPPVPSDEVKQEYSVHPDERKAEKPDAVTDGEGEQPVDDPAQGEAEETAPTRMQKLANELAALQARERDIRAEMQAITAEQQAETVKTTPLDHQKALRAASEALRKAGMIPDPNGRHR